MFHSCLFIGQVGLVGRGGHHPLIPET